MLPPQDVSFEIAARTLAAPPSISGGSQVVSSDAGVWKATFGNIRVMGQDAVLTFRAIAALLEGRLGAILVPLCRGYQPVIRDPASLYDPVPHSDDSTFDDGSAYVGATTEVSFSADVAARAVSATVTIAYGGTLQPGQHFSVGERLYRLRSVTYAGESEAAITFRPPLREAASAGDRLEFDDPVCRMRLLTDAEMDIELRLRKFGQATVNFVEDL
jgi:hypothetical protein